MLRSSCAKITPGVAAHGPSTEAARPGSASHELLPPVGADGEGIKDEDVLEGRLAFFGGADAGEFVPGLPAVVVEA